MDPTIITALNSPTPNVVTDAAGPLDGHNRPLRDFFSVNSFVFLPNLHNASYHLKATETARNTKNFIDACSMNSVN